MMMMCLQKPETKLTRYTHMYIYLTTPIGHLQLGLVCRCRINPSQHIQNGCFALSLIVGGGGGGGGVGGHQFSFASPTAAPSGKEGWYLSIAWQAAIHLCLTVALSPPLCSQFRIELVDVQRGFQFIAAE